jgi:hypothetical protein
LGHQLPFKPLISVEQSVSDQPPEAEVPVAVLRLDGRDPIREGMDARRAETTGLGLRQPVGAPAARAQITNQTRKPAQIGPVDAPQPNAAGDDSQGFVVAGEVVPATWYQLAALSSFPRRELTPRRRIPRPCPKTGAQNGSKTLAAGFARSATQQTLANSRLPMPWTHLSSWYHIGRQADPS